MARKRPEPQEGLPRSPSWSAQDESVITGRFRETVYRHYREHPRKLAWRETQEPFHILVSEMMLQQTRAERVAQKYPQFMVLFPRFRALAEAPLRQVLAAWQGLGYNRRALALRRCAARVVEEFSGRLPEDEAVLRTFPGIGPATAASIAVFAYGKPTVFVETNIRRVFIHFFFPDAPSVKDTEVLHLVDRTLDRTNPREWYYALMDYGVMLGRRVPNPNRRSAHYARQLRFEGSDRQVRGRIIRALTSCPRLAFDELAAAVEREPARVAAIVEQLEAEGLVVVRDEHVSIA